MQRSLPTVRIADRKSASGFLWINESEFDASVHTLYDDAAGPAPALTDVNGIGEKTAETLGVSGIDSLAALIAAGAEKLAEATGLAQANIEKWQAAASELE